MMLGPGFHSDKKKKTCDLSIHNDREDIASNMHGTVGATEDVFKSVIPDPWNYFASYQLSSLTTPIRASIFFT